FYLKDGFLERRADGLFRKSEFTPPYKHYEMLPEKQFGALDVYTPKGIDPKTNQPYRQHPNADDAFVYRDETGQVQAFITCSNRDVPAPPCEHTFNLEPKAKSVVNVIYRRSLLP